MVGIRQVELLEGFAIAAIEAYVPFDDLVTHDMSVPLLGGCLHPIVSRSRREFGACHLAIAGFPYAPRRSGMSNGIQEADQEILGTIKRNAGVGMVVGIIVAIAGVLALLSPFVAGLSVAIAVGVLLVASGVSRLFLAFKMGSFGHGLLVFLLGVLSIVVGGYMVFRPGMALATLTLVLAAWFFVDGIFEIIWAFRLRPIKGWGWTLFSGIVALLLAIMIWRQFPVSGMWAVGTLVGVHMIFGGSAMASISGAARGAAKEAQAA